MTMAIFTNLPSNDFRSYLEHHGVKGQKWYKRRYQNEDGSLTELGRQHYGVGKARGTQSAGSDSKLSAARQALKDGPEKYETKGAFLEAISKDCLAFDCDPTSYLPRSEINKRADRAAILGIKALAKMDSYVDMGDTDVDNPDSGSKSWFVYEDQTIGMALIADLINQGYSAKECKKLIDLAHDNYSIKYDEKLDTRTSGMIFDLDEGDWDGSLKRFAESCESVKKEDKNLFTNEADEKPLTAKTDYADPKYKKLQDKIDAINDKKQSPKYLKNLDRKQQIELELEKLRSKTQKIRDEKLFNDKNPGLFDRMKLNKERKLEKQLAKINDNIYKLDKSLDKLTIKQNKYKKVLDEFDDSKAKGLSSMDFDGDSVRIFKNDAATREAMRVAKAKGWDALSNKQKSLLGDYVKAQTNTMVSAMAETAKNPSQSKKSYSDTISNSFKAIPEALSRKVDSTKYNDNIYSKSYLVAKKVYNDALSTSENPLTKAAVEIAKNEVNRLYENGPKGPFDGFSKSVNNWTMNKVFTKQYLSQLSDKEILELKKDIALISILSNA